MNNSQIDQLKKLLYNCESDLERYNVCNKILLTLEQENNSINTKYPVNLIEQKEYRKWLEFEIKKYNPKHIIDSTEHYEDLSNTNGPEKVIYLNELGILDYLKKQIPFNHNNNKLAQVLSAITGEKQSTIYSYINPILNETAQGDNNPLTRKNKVAPITMCLNDMGFSTK